MSLPKKAEHLYGAEFEVKGEKYKYTVIHAGKSPNEVSVAIFNFREKGVPADDIIDEIVTNMEARGFMTNFQREDLQHDPELEFVLRKELATS